MPKSSCVFDKGLGTDKGKPIVFYDSINIRRVLMTSLGSPAGQHEPAVGTVRVSLISKPVKYYDEGFLFDLYALAAQGVAFHVSSI